MLRDIAEFQIAADLTGAGQRSHHRAQATAVNENYVSEMQDDGAPVAENPGDMAPQRLDFSSGDQPALAADDGHSPHIPRLELQSHPASGSKPRTKFSSAMARERTRGFCLCQGN